MGPWGTFAKTGGGSSPKYIRVHRAGTYLPPCPAPKGRVALSGAGGWFGVHAAEKGDAGGAVRGGRSP